MDNKIMQQEQNQKKTFTGRAIQMVVESMEYRKNWYKEALAKQDLSDDDYADLYNDEQLLEGLLEEINKLSVPKAEMTISKNHSL
jgi:hypothetical protein